MNIKILNAPLFAVIDDADWFITSRYRWNLQPNGYVRASWTGGRVSLHRLITNAPAGMIVDHINHDKLDNRRVNLRIVTANQNQHNRRSHCGTSKYKGVHLKSGKWEVNIMANRKMNYIGRFTSELEAAKAYNKAAQELHGNFAHLNMLEP